MKKPNLSPEQHNALSGFEQSSPAVAELVRQVIQFYISELDSVKNIDAKGNMGLQALASQKSVETLEMIFEVLFPGISKIGTSEKKKISQYR